MGAADSSVALAFGLIGLAACGPSFQAIYEGNARFEHCYALEENPQALMPDKAACWRDWSERYTYGQTRDRVNYATARYVALSEAGSLPTDEALMMAAPGETPRNTTITAPTPTNAFAPPPKVLEVDRRTAPLTSPSSSEVPLPQVDSGAPGTPAIAPVASLPAASCADVCGATFRTCNGGCSSDGGPGKGKSCQACLRTYRGCMRDCFK
jgi:hypothetical protein